MNKKQARIHALGLAKSILRQELNSPSELILYSVSDEDDHAKVWGEFERIIETVEKQLERLDSDSSVRESAGG